MILLSVREFDWEAIDEDEDDEDIPLHSDSLASDSNSDSEAGTTDSTTKKFGDLMSLCKTGGFCM